MQRLTALVIAIILAVGTVKAQNEPEYLLELGAGAGLVAYEGDLNGNLLTGMQPMGGIVGKYKMNPRMALAACIGFGQLKGSAKIADTQFPEPYRQDISFKSSITDISLRYEYNFWAFGNGEEYRGAKRLTPFIAIGLGMSIAKPQDSESAVAGQMMIGGGVKYKLASRWNLAAEWMMHFTGSDRLDGLEAPYGIESSGLFKNTDCYSVLAVTVTYDLWAKCRTCMNDRE